MLLVKTKNFDDFNIGKNELLRLIPSYVLLYRELNNINSFEECTKLTNSDDIKLSVEFDGNNYKFILSIYGDQYMFLNRSINFNGWEIDYDKCEGLSVRDINMIFNN